MTDDADDLLPKVHQAFRRYKVRLSTEQERLFATYLATMQRWNRTHNLTSIREVSQAIERHLVEPALLQPLLEGSGPVVLDVGSGAGVPGVALAILDPGRRVRLVEANSKKAAFLREVVALLELPNVEVLEGRLEDLLEQGVLEGPVHVVTTRAWTSSWGEMLGAVAALMVPGGRAVLLVGEDMLRTLRRNLASGTDLARPTDPEWRRAARVGWQIKRVVALPHLQRGFAVALEFPSF